MTPSVRPWISLLLVVAAMLSVGQVTLHAQMNTISISYGVDGAPPLYTYLVKRHSDAWISCEIVAQGETVEHHRFDWRSDIDILSRDLLADFGQVASKVQPMTEVPDGQRKKIAIVCVGPGVETAATVTGSDEWLTAFIAKSVVIRELFSRVSLGKPKMYRLWESPSPMGSFLTPLSSEEKEAARKTKDGR